MTCGSFSAQKEHFGPFSRATLRDIQQHRVARVCPWRFLSKGIHRVTTSDSSMFHGQCSGSGMPGDHLSLRKSPTTLKCRLMTPKQTPACTIRETLQPANSFKMVFQWMYCGIAEKEDDFRVQSILLFPPQLFKILKRFLYIPDAPAN